VLQGNIANRLPVIPTPAVVLPNAAIAYPESPQIHPQRSWQGASRIWGSAVVPRQIFRGAKLSAQYAEQNPISPLDGQVAAR
jgi:hypothetical protein